MKKTGSVKIAGETRTLCLTLPAAQAIDELCGGITNIVESYQGKSLVEAHRHTLSILSALLEGGRAYAALSGAPDEPAYTVEELGILCGLGDLGEYRQAVMEAIVIGMAREVEVEPERKNGKATRKTP